VAIRYDQISSYYEWTRSDAYASEVADVLELVDREGVEGIYFVSPSVDGRPIGKLVTRELFERVARRGIRMHPLAVTDFRATVWGDPIGFGEEDAEGAMVPDFGTLRRLPWRPELARVLCFYYDLDSGELYDHDSRGTLARHEQAFRQESGATMFAGIEPELMWLRRKNDGTLEHTTNATAFYEIAYLEEFEPIMLDLLEYGKAMGLHITHSDAEDRSQVEVNQAPAAPLAYADAFFTYRQICRVVARKHGLIVTFMPKPFMGCSANGHHHNLSLMSDEGENVLVGELKGACQLSEIGAHFLGGLLEHADALTLVGAPNANSYKRFWDVGYWAPFHKSYGFNNRSCLFRISDVGRIEARQMDASCNPYLTISSCLVAGLDGIRRGLDPGEPIQDNMMKDLRVPREERIPITLTEAIEAFKADPLMHELFRPKLYETFLGLRQDDLDRFWSQVSAWELDFYLERWP
jgi:glutamine synthetase